jgi:tetratricopeptide (TPR) repeat protein
LEHVEAAVLLKQDTTPGDLFRIANLQLAAGLVLESNRTAGTALSLHGAQPDSVRGSLPLSAGTVLLATGQILGARDVVYQHRSTRYIRDPASDGLISYAGAEPIPYAVSVMGGGGVLGEPIRRELAAMDSIWNAAGHSGAQLAALRNGATMRMATGLVQDSSVLADWGRLVDLDQHLWGALALPAGRRADSEDYEAALNEALEWNDRAKRTFLIAWKARTSGAPELAHKIFCRLDSMAFKTNSLDSGQGLRVVSLFYRAEALEEMGRFEEAEEALEEFLSAWPAPDELAQQTVVRAEAALQRIREKTAGSGTP